MSFDLVLFGGTGDLTWRKLMPALFQAWRHGKLPADGRIVAVARDERSDDQYRASARSMHRSGRATTSSRALRNCCTTAAWTSRSPSITPV
jgi:glucose-6-phosphate 1-dehydrogenase